jgi:hypothetical protein
MDRIEPARRTRRFGPIRAASVALFAVLLISGPAFAACSGAHAAAPAGSSAVAMPATQGDMAMAGASVAWTARPDFVRSNAATEEAYAFAIQHPQIVQWMPCYCGCEAMGHGSNLDCYFKHGQPGDKPVFEEHASFCDICVQITLKTKQLNAQGKSLHEIRQVIDQTFGGSAAPGTLTAQPPV